MLGTSVSEICLVVAAYPKVNECPVQGECYDHCT